MTTPNSSLYIPTATLPGGAVVSKIPCCLCGTMIVPNNANQCSTCLAQQVDLQSIVQQGPGGSVDHNIIVYQCRQCRMFQSANNENAYIAVSNNEAPELLAICLKKIPALSPSGSHHHHLQLVDAGWIWTEPHSMRLKLHVTVRAEVSHVMVQQRCSVELHIQWKMCPECNREYTNRTWQALVQVRQDRKQTESKSGLVVLEQAIAKHKDIRKHVLRIDQPSKNGFDFYFLSLTHALAFTNFLQRIACSPMRVKQSSKLVSTDNHSNTSNTKHTITCDMVPLCRHDLLLLHKQASSGSCGRLAGRLILAANITSGVLHFVDASPKISYLSNNNNNNNNNTNKNSGKGGGGGGIPWMHQISADSYYRNEKHFKLLLTSSRLVRFVVLDVELLDRTQKQQQQQQEFKGPSSGLDKYALADVLVARESDFGQNDDTVQCISHLGNLIAAGDVVLGYDLTCMNWTGAGEWEIMNSLQSKQVIPDVILVKKAKITAAEKAVSKKKKTTPTATKKEANQGDDDDEDEDDEEGAGGGVGSSRESDGKPRLSKKKERREKRLGGRRRKEMAEAAMRMGFLEDQAEDEQRMAEAKAANEAGDAAAGGAPESEDDNDDDDDDAFMADAQLQAELSELERNLAQLDSDAAAAGKDSDRAPTSQESDQ